MTSQDVKVVLIGNTNVGKTTLQERYALNKYTDQYKPTLGLAFKRKTEVVNGSPISLGVWDTAGSERYMSLAPMYYRGASAAVMCFDITDRESWDELPTWVKLLRTISDTCRLYICATKVDLLQEELTSCTRTVSQKELADYAHEIDASYVETSAKTGQNISKLFQQIASDYHTDGQEGLQIIEKDSFILSHPQEDKPSWRIAHVTRRCCGVS